VIRVKVRTATAGDGIGVQAKWEEREEKVEMTSMILDMDEWEENGTVARNRRDNHDR
tara:strand:+ start:149 stop:319 length:171 start_codon:yes stop_codon:yes gene_type:complete